MKEELIRLDTVNGAISIQRISLNLTTMGLYEGVSNESIKENLEFQGHPFGRTPCPIIYEGLDADDLSETYCLWALLEGSPKDSSLCFSSLAFCLITDSIVDPAAQLIRVLPSIDYWENCEDFDL